MVAEAFVDMEERDAVRDLCRAVNRRLYRVSVVSAAMLLGWFIGSCWWCFVRGGKR